MTSYVAVAVVSGVLFAVLDGVLNANALARRLFAVYKPIARRSINVAAGLLIDLAFGFLMAALFLLLYDSLPGASGPLKGVSFALLVWFLRVVMSTASQWMMFRVSLKASLYSLAAGLGEMLTLGVLYGLTLESAT